MLQYCNAYTFATDSADKEVILALRQNSPDLDESGDAVEVKSEIIASCVMRKEFALSMAKELINMLEKSSDE